jgi:FAD/FMN-containing dehydrogenase
LSYSLKSIKLEDRIPYIIEDATVPLKKLGKLFLIIDKINKKFQTKTIMYGHAGNGNIHVRLISNRKKIKNLEKISETYFDQVIKLGGTITGEHGDGIARSEFIKKQYGYKNFQIFKELKRFFDPRKILNPGKITSHNKRFKIVENF